MNQAPHPNAAKVFANWLLGRDGQEIFSRSMGVGSRLAKGMNAMGLKCIGVAVADRAAGPHLRAL